MKVEFYVFKLHNYSATLTTSGRVLHRRRTDGQSAVRLDRNWAVLHDAMELKSLLRTKVIRAKKTLLVDGYQVDSKSVFPKPFVKDWENNLGPYPTFGPGGI